MTILLYFIFVETFEFAHCCCRSPVGWSKLFWIMPWIRKEYKEIRKKRPIIIIIIFFCGYFNFSGIKRNNIDVWFIVCGYCIYSFDCVFFFFVFRFFLRRCLLATTLPNQYTSVSVCAFFLWWWWCRLLLGENYTRKISRMKPRAVAAAASAATAAATTESHKSQR